MVATLKISDLENVTTNIRNDNWHFISIFSDEIPVDESFGFLTSETRVWLFQYETSYPEVKSVRIMLGNGQEEDILIPAGKTVTLTYDGSQTKTIYLPEYYTSQVKYVYAANDGSTYYDDQLTQLAQLALVKFEKELAVGWNLFSLPIQPENTELNDVLGSVQGKYNYVWTTPQGGSWKSNKQRFGRLTTIEPRKGYMIEMVASGKLEVAGAPDLPTMRFDLKSGWNLISFPFPYDIGIPIEEAIADVKTNINLIFQYKSLDVGVEWSSYSPARPPFLNTLTEFNPKFGLWIQIFDDTTWFLRNGRFTLS